MGWSNLNELSAQIYFIGLNTENVSQVVPLDGSVTLINAS